MTGAESGSEPHQTETLQCDGCGEAVESPAETSRVPGHRETVVLAFCPDCTETEDP